MGASGECRQQGLFSFPPFKTKRAKALFDTVSLVKLIMLYRRIIIVLVYRVASGTTQISLWILQQLWFGIWLLLEPEVHQKKTPVKICQLYSRDRWSLYMRCWRIKSYFTQRWREGSSKEDLLYYYSKILREEGKHVLLSACAINIYHIISKGKKNLVN